ncbi:MAG: preprotein translocase subunit TatA [Alphaproteobacteria bacterium]|jgi:sec-independent protein translocase protein TatA|nr:preprotein translocase subunit TatA [Alphaproteobacteria bacterium]
MGSFSIWHWLIVLAVVLLLFGGRGKISSLMGDFGKGLKAFKKGVGTEENPDGTTTTTATGEPRIIGAGTTTASSNTVNEPPVIKR